MRILELRLKTSDLETMRRYYGEVLGLLVIEEQTSVIRFQAGETRLVFEHQPDMHSIYHFAFNIPENQMEAACEWLVARTRVVTDNGIPFHFADWNAHAVYFYDPAGNILELIARHTLPNTSHAPFSSQSLLCISEIGLVTDDVRSSVETICQRLQVSLYSDEYSDAFSAVGDEHGLFITVKRGRLWKATNIAAEPNPATITVVGTSPGRLTLPDALCEIRMEDIELKDKGVAC